MKNETKMAVCKCGHTNTEHTDWWKMCLKCDCSEFVDEADADVVRLIADLKRLPAHSAIRFSYDGISESYPMDRFHRLTAMAENAISTSQIAALRSALETIRQECADVREGVANGSPSIL